MARLFISHSSRNNDKADRGPRLAREERLGRRLPRPRPGARHRRRPALEGGVAEGRLRCELVLALVSPEWLASSWCKSEIDAARLMGKKVIVALIGIDKSQVPLDLTDEQLIDLTGDPHAYRRLKEGLKRAGLDPTSFPFDADAGPTPGSPISRRRTPRCSSDATRRSCAASTRCAVSPAPGSRACSSSWARRARASRRSCAPAVAAPQAGRSAWLPLPIIRPERAAISGKYGLAQALQQIMSEPRFADGIRQRGLPRSRADIQDFIEKTDDGLASSSRRCATSRKRPVRRERGAADDRPRHRSGRGAVQ